MASALLLVVLAAVYGIWFGMQRTYMFAEEDMQAQSEARAAMNEMVELIRTAREPDRDGIDPADIPESAQMVIVRAEPNSLICWTDIDRDDSHDVELVRFQVEGKNLYRYTSHVFDAGLLADPVSPSVSYTRLVGTWVSNGAESGTELFSYVNSNGVDLDATGVGGVEDPDDIREVHIDLMVDVVVGEAPESHLLSSVVQPRNLR